MEHSFLFFVKFFELIGLGYFAETYPHVVYTWMVMVVLIALGLIVRPHLKLIPGKLQNVLEAAVEGLENFTVETGGEKIRPMFPLLATLFLFIMVSNLIGLVPGFMPPTSNLNTTLACALIVFVMTHYLGIKANGVQYIKQFTGPVWWLTPLFLVIEIISHFARILSLSFRLFGNMMGHEIVLAILFMLVGAFFLPLPIMVLGVMVGVVQAFVFYLLSVIYFSTAMDEAH